MLKLFDFYFVNSKQSVVIILLVRILYLFCMFIFLFDFFPSFHKILLLLLFFHFSVVENQLNVRILAVQRIYGAIRSEVCPKRRLQKNSVASGGVLMKTKLSLLKIRESNQRQHHSRHHRDKHHHFSQVSSCSF